jgi:hypothetical protein
MYPAPTSAQKALLRIKALKEGWGNFDVTMLISREDQHL